MPIPRTLHHADDHAPAFANDEPTTSADEASSDEAAALARVIDRSGMGGIAVFALQALRPLHWLGGQATWALQPFVESFGLRRRTGGKSGITSQGVARLLEHDDGVDRLLAQLDALRKARE